MAAILLIEPGSDARDNALKILEAEGWQVFAYCDSKAALSNAGDAWLAVVGPGLDAAGRACLEEERGGEGRIRLIDVVPAQTLGARTRAVTRIQWGGAHIDLLSGEAQSGSKRVVFTGLEGSLLAFFYEHQGVPLERSLLLVQVWGYRDGVVSRAVDTAVRRLRRKLSAIGLSNVIQTVRNAGYLMSPPVQPAPTPASVPTPESSPAPATQPERPVLPSVGFANPGQDLIGRNSLLASLPQRMMGGRLLTLVGPGGVGKTTLARAVAGRSPPSGGVVWVELSPVRSLEGFVQAVADAMGDVRGDRPDIGVALRLRGPVRLVLDNFEQLVELCAESLAMWFQRAPELQVLATSREAVKIGAEVVVRVHPLELPPLDADEEQLRQAPAVQLLTHRLEAIGRSVVGVEALRAAGAIARELDGLPLALELAAARGRLFELEEIQSLLTQHPESLVTSRRDRPARHASLDSTLAWSWDLLDEADRQTLQVLALFPTAIPVVVAASVLGADTAGGIGSLESLYDRSMVTLLPAPAGSGRWVRVLQPVRRWVAATHPHSSPAAQVAYVRALVGSSPETLLDTHQGLIRLRAQRESLEQAVAQLTGRLRACAVWLLGQLANRFGRPATAIALLTPLLDDPDSIPGRAASVLVHAIRNVRGSEEAAAFYGLQQLGQMSARSLAGLHRGGAWALLGTGDPVGAAVAAKQAVKAARATGNPIELAFSLCVMAQGLSLQGSAHLHARARRLADEAVDVLPSNLGPHRRGSVHYMLGSVFLEIGELELAVPMLQGAITDLELVGDLLLSAKATGNLAGALFRQGDLMQAKAAVKSELRTYRQLQLIPHTVFPLGHLGLIAAAEGRLDEAHELLEEAIAIGEESGNKRAVDAFRAHLAALPEPASHS